MTDSYKPDIKVELQFIRQYGKPDDAQGNMFGLISSYAIDRNENLYVADDAFKTIKMFSKEGKFIKKFGNGAGSGPGEFSSIQGICLDPSGNVYSIDKINLTLNVFDPSNNLLNTLKISYLPAQIIAPYPMTIDILGFSFSYEGNLIKRYNMKEKTNEPILSYCERKKGKGSEIIMRSGNSGRIVQASSGNIYYSFFYPYEIRKYSSDGKYLGTIKGDRSLPAPLVNSKTGIIESPAGIKEFVILPNEILLLLIYDSSSGKLKQYFDFIDGKNGKFLGSKSLEDLGIENIRFLRADYNGNIYADYMNPYPHIMKYKMQFKINE